MTRVAIVSHAHPAFSLGGGEIAAHRQFTHLRDRGVDAIFLGIKFDNDKTPKSGSPLVKVTQIDEADFALPGPEMSAVTLDHVSAEDEAAVLDALLALKAGVYHFHHVWNIGVGTIHRLMNARPDATFALTLHEFLAICANHGQMVKTGGQLCPAAHPRDCADCLAGAPAKFFLRSRKLLSLLQRFDPVIAPSAFLKSRFVDWGLDERRIHVIENGLPPAAANPASPPPAEVMQRFAFFGQATPTKGLDVLIRAAAALESREVRDLKIAVHGVSAEEVSRTNPDAPRPSALLEFNGRYRPQDAARLMRNYGWIIIPSTWWENSPVVIQEARQAGVRVIVSEIGGMAEKAAGWGLGFPVGDAVALADLIERIARDPKGALAGLSPIPAPVTVAEVHREFAALLSARTGGRIQLAA